MMIQSIEKHASLFIVQAGDGLYTEMLLYSHNQNTALKG